MLNKNEFRKIDLEMKDFDKRRENVINKAHEIIRMSKLVIHSIHKDKTNIAHLIKKMSDLVDKMRTRGELQFSSFYKVAMQEYVEAICFYQIIKNNKLPTQVELKVSAPDYLAGLCDLTGELMRKANNLWINRKPKEALKIIDLVSDIYEAFIHLDIRNQDLRKKADSIKYNLRKLEDLENHIKSRQRK